MKSLVSELGHYTPLTISQVIIKTLSLGKFKHDVSVNMKNYSYSDFLSFFLSVIYQSFQRESKKNLRVAEKKYFLHTSVK